jgi:hypothetical protein
LPVPRCRFPAYYHLIYLQDLCELEGVQSLPPEAVCDVLRAALDLQWTEGLEVLCSQLPQAHHVPACSLRALVDSAIRQLDGEAAEHLLRLEGADEVEPHVVEQLMRLALQLRLPDVIEHLCMLDSACHLTAEQVANTVNCALLRGKGSSGAAVKVLELPGAQDLSSSSLPSLLVSAACHGAKEVVVHLCGLPAAQELGPTGVEAALGFGAMEQLDGPSIAALCRLPGAQQLSACGVASMLHSLLRRDSYSVPASATALTQQLLQLPAAAQIPADELTELLQVGSQRKLSAEVMQALLKLHATALRRPRT